MSHQAVGIDLGTSNSVVAVATEQISVVPCTQATAPSAIDELTGLPSALYLAAGVEFAPNSFRLPWSEADAPIIGSFAREHGASVPGRVVTSAKSWLSNSRCDRAGAILPWGGDVPESEKVSPVTASVLYLKHLRQNLLFHRSELQSATSVLTVPASFDEVARTLTQQAAVEAGWGETVLLEEPQAALYAWIAACGDAWREHLSPGQVILVCDVGGGTTDFSLIQVLEQGGELALERLSVGEHILLGGDNMDLALAYQLKVALEASGGPVDQWQFLSLIHQARIAKEQLFKNPSLVEVPIAVASRGASLFATARQTMLTQEQLRATVVEGFFPITDLSDLPQRSLGFGLQELGLPYASDAAISKHLAKFLSDSLLAVRSLGELAERVPTLADRAVRPSAVLFNGGVFEADILRSNILALLRQWGSEDIVELVGSELHTAVARGAAYYGRMRVSGQGVRIRAGTARSYYLGVQASMPAVPGMTPPVFGLCVVPQGAEEGSTYALPEKEFALRTGEPAEFRFFSSTARAGDEVGAVVGNAARDLDEQARLTLTLPSDNADAIAVRLRSDVTELGTLELWMEEPSSDRRWKLEFDLRAQGGAAT